MADYYKYTGNPRIQDSDLKIPLILPKVDLTLEEISISNNPINEEKYDIAVENCVFKSICNISGTPIYLQNPIDYECPVCKNRMKYVATVFSDTGSNLTKYNVDFNIGDIFLYYCFCKKCEIIVCETQEI